MVELALLSIEFAPQLFATPACAVAAALSCQQRGGSQRWLDTTVHCYPGEPCRNHQLLKSTLEQEARVLDVKVFNPTTDNAYVCARIEKEANGIWLLNWRKYLCRAKANGGKGLVIPGDNLSNMQLAEKDVAEDKGVPVTRIFMLTCRTRR